MDSNVYSLRGSNSASLRQRRMTFIDRHLRPVFAAAARSGEFICAHTGAQVQANASISSWTASPQAP
jgi:hypothetical protein